MKYVGKVAIYRGDGRSIFERQLTPEEMIEAILSSNPDAASSEPLEVTEEDEPVRAPKPSRPGVRACCGAQMRGRHMKGCSEGKSTPDPDRRRTVSHRKPFSEPTYHVVKTLLDKDGRGVDDISAEKGLDLDEVRRINLSDDYQDYLAIA